MKFIKGFLIAAVVLAAIVVGGGFLLPATYRVERSATIEAAPDKVYALVADPKAWAKWTVWNKRDPAMKVAYSGAATGAGAKWSWESRTEGSGEMAFTRAEAPAIVEYTLHFPEFGTRSKGALALAPAGAGTKITWSNEGDVGANPLMHWFAAFMDRLVGPDFEAGLSGLKALAEKG